jgi:DNA-binding IclR family transcriptional regulator
MALAAPALRVLEAAGAMDLLTREQAAEANGSGLTTADDYLRALERLGFMERRRTGRGKEIGYALTIVGRALVERRSLLRQE